MNVSVRIFGVLRRSAGTRALWRLVECSAYML